MPGPRLRKENRQRRAWILPKAAAHAALHAGIGHEARGLHAGVGRKARGLYAAHVDPVLHRHAESVWAAAELLHGLGRRTPLALLAAPASPPPLIPSPASS